MVRFQSNTGVWTFKAQPERLCSIVVEGNTLGTRAPGFHFALQGQTRFRIMPELCSRNTVSSTTSGICGIEGWFWACPFRARLVLGAGSEGDALDYDGTGPSA